MTDSYKVQTSQLPNFCDENMKRNEEQKTFSSSYHLYSILPSLIARSIKLFVKFYRLEKIEDTMYLESPIYTRDIDKTLREMYNDFLNILRNVLRRDKLRNMSENDIYLFTCFKTFTL